MCIRDSSRFARNTLNLHDILPNLRHLDLKQALNKRRMGAGYNDLRPLVRLFYFKDVDLQAVVDIVLLGIYRFAYGDNAFRTAKLYICLLYTSPQVLSFFNLAVDEIKASEQRSRLLHLSAFDMATDQRCLLYTSSPPRVFPPPASKKKHPNGQTDIFSDPGTDESHFHVFPRDVYKRQGPTIYP